MNVLLDNLALFREGFLGTLWLTVVSALLAVVLGLLIAGFRVSPVPPLRIFGTLWVNVLRNTPLTLLFLVAFFVVPKVLFPGVDSFVLAVCACGFYTSSFVAEAVRSGINTVPMGQAEAARAIGMTFTQTMRIVVLPQATRSVIPPLSSIFIALTKNTAVAGAFDNVDLFNIQKTLSNDGYDIAVIFIWITLGYLVITYAINGLFRLLEKGLEVAR
ncbi:MULTISPECIES: amino acid ABC transporter permease [Streptomyces]|uniref:Amino acid ABC transporter permease n=1 Tax=Streptomyces qinglanensis TaxID=943816 RepID=A0A1E7K827_9ACTN|nr:MULTISPECIES: amino acid ABC transporter permease [Streptomyces]MBE9500506.1 amino acid ABC transporter permease [Streptomyces sp. GKU 257-1]OEV00044.1 amino acid ABC transporter permease [Streptomyces qinglanensis]OEV06940.1 amino acid ABC transporter permease [Streptomyces nanshensis]SES36021.1 glutamate transport system permease protein [Streptomyces qinglanensis]